MAVQVYIPTPFRRATSNQDRVSVEADDVREALDASRPASPRSGDWCGTRRGDIHAHVNIYVNSEAIDDLQGLATALKDGDEVSIIPALAGGGAGDRRRG